MNQIEEKLPELKLVGITCRTNNTQIFESDPSTNKIAATVQKYFHNTLAEKINHRIKPGTTYCIYTDYESDHTGDYTYFIGEEVKSFDNLSEGFEKITIPTQSYAKFTSGPGAMPDLCINAWKKIWTMTPADFNGKRAYLADFEVYDERASDHQKVVFDIYIGISK
jgi:predicted transcriptional regulator YdeE